jgi:hypothetical protein
MHTLLSSKIASLNRLNRHNESISKEIASQRIAIEVAKEVKKILHEDSSEVRENNLVVSIKK